MTNTKPHMYYWYEEENGTKWELLIEGDYEKYEDGTAGVVDLDVKYYAKVITEGVVSLVHEENVPDEILGFAESLLDSPTTEIEIQQGYEEVNP